MGLTLRTYQRDAVDALWQALRDGEQSPLACVPTAGGKGPIVATLCMEAVQKWTAKVLVLVHVKELVEQLSETIRRNWPDALCPIGVVSAGLGQNSIQQITVAGIQSIFRRACDLGRIDLIVIDEAHLIPPDGDGMYRTLINALKIINPKLRMVGVTATPYRLGHGLVCGPDNVFTKMVYDIPVKTLMDWPSEEGGPYLCRLRGKDGGSPDVSGVHKRGGEYIAGELEACMSDEAKVKAAVVEIMRHSGGRNGILVFCCGVKHAQLVTDELGRHGIYAPAITGETPGDVRDDLVKRFKARELRCLVNINVLSTGFDAPHVDMVVLLRPTESPGLHYQQLGRGFRISPHKSECIVLDMAGNIARHGPIETLNERIISNQGGGPAPVKTCNECLEINSCGASHCIACNNEFEKSCAWCGKRNKWTIETCGHCGNNVWQQARHETTAAEGDPVSVAPVVAEWFSIDDVEYAEHTKKGAADDHPKTLRVTYWNGYDRVASEWVCIEHEGFAGNKALRWLADRMIPSHGCLAQGPDGTPVIDSPDGVMILTSASVAKLGTSGGLKQPSRISLIKDGKYMRIEGYDWSEGNEEREVETVLVSDVDDAPF